MWPSTCCWSSVHQIRARTSSSMLCRWFHANEYRMKSKMCSWAGCPLWSKNGSRIVGAVIHSVAEEREKAHTRTDKIKNANLFRQTPSIQRTYSVMRKFIAIEYRDSIWPKQCKADLIVYAIKSQANKWHEHYLHFLKMHGMMCCVDYRSQRERKFKNDRTQRRDGMCDGGGEKTRNKLHNMFALFSQWKQEQTSVRGYRKFTHDFIHVNFLKSMNFAPWHFDACGIFFSFSLPSFPSSLPQSDLISECMHVQWISMNFSSIIDSGVYDFTKNRWLERMQKSYSFTQSKPSMHVEFMQFCSISQSPVFRYWVVNAVSSEWINISIIDKKCVRWLKLWRIFDGF